MANWNELMEQRVRELEHKASGFGERFDAVDKRLASMDRKIDALPTKSELKAFTEAMATRVQNAAEGFGATLDAIRRDISDISTLLKTKDGDRDLVLKNHVERIGALERRPPP